MRILALVVVVMLAVAIEASGYTGRSDLVTAQRQGCERSKLDRRANATGWRTAQHARTATSENLSLPVSERTTALKAALVYQRVARELERRSRIDCARVFPAASVWPWAH